MATAPSSLTFPVAVGGDDGDLENLDTTYPPTGSTIVDTTNSLLGLIQEESGGLYTMGHAYLRFDTSAIPDGATVTAARIELVPSIKSSTQTRGVVAEWFNAAAWPLNAADYTPTVASGNAFAAQPLTSFTVGQKKTIALLNVANVSTSGYTALRLSVDGGAPAAGESQWISFASLEVVP